MKFEKLLKKPIITEKSMRLVAEENKYVFEVSNDATKGKIRNAIEAVFGVSVIGVAVLKNRGRLKRSMVGRRKEYRSKDTKKAIVKLSEKDSINLFDQKE